MNCCTMSTLIALFVFLEGFLIIFAALEPVALYGDDGEIRVKRLVGFQTVKTFKVREYRIEYITLDYNQDLIFVAGNSRILRLHLVDENGNQIASGRGKLFTDVDADHIETQVSTVAKYINGLTVDSVAQKLYVADSGNMYEMSYDGSNTRTVLPQVSGTYRSPQFLDGSFYFTHKLYSNKLDTAGVFRTKLNPTEQVPYSSWEKLATGLDIFAIALESSSKKLYYADSTKEEIRVIETNLSTSSYPIVDARIVVSDNRATDGVRAISAYKDALVWSMNYKVLIGYLSDSKDFISMQKIYVVDDKGYQYQPMQIVVFEHLFPSPTTSS